ncbi:radical SAM protein [Salidesulfovibrio onnuriiensis]|uniref:radical SAM protein n=1 Tax=Salidesulfovibrio onnuriiensis TaxID=2583823 RepID=UPI0011C860B5|nr:radical SAM protein [Salidesulfovibrio onnuriiensis]
MKPGYLSLHHSGELSVRASQAVSMLADCRCCPRECRVNRLEDERGFCGIGRKAVIASFNPHFGEESPLVGSHGSGTIFFAGCNLKCVFCQNYDISHDPDAGLAAEPEELAGVMLRLQQQGCHNINLVTPSHVVPQILEALPIAVEHGLRAPLVYNTSGYDSLEALKLLDGVVDIYMPDVKIWDAAQSRELLRTRDYPKRAKASVREMHRQVGDLRLDGGIAVAGLLVRHLVMPGDIAGTRQWMRFLAGLSRDTYVNIMDQYHPCGEAKKHPHINRTITPKEFQSALDQAKNSNIKRLDRRTADFFDQIFKNLH